MVVAAPRRWRGWFGGGQVQPVGSAGVVMTIRIEPIDVPPEPPDKDYMTANRVEVFDEPRAIAWQPGTESPETGAASTGSVDQLGDG